MYERSPFWKMLDSWDKFSERTKKKIRKPKDNEKKRRKTSEMCDHLNFSKITHSKFTDFVTFYAHSISWLFHPHFLITKENKFVAHSYQKIVILKVTHHKHHVAIFCVKSDCLMCGIWMHVRIVEILNATYRWLKIYLFRKLQHFVEMQRHQILSFPINRFPLE